MFNECLEVFEDILNKKTEQWLADNYVPTSGTYVLIDMDKNFSMRSIIEIITSKKTGDVEGSDHKDYRLVSFLDRNSRLVTMNKAMDTGKIIHSNNYYSFFVKKDSIVLGKLGEKNIEGYYQVLEQPKTKYKSPKAREIYEEVEQKLGEVNSETLRKIKEWIKTSLNTFIKENSIDTSGKNYLKLFFVYEDDDKTREEVKREGTRYLLPNIYNKNDYNVKASGEIYGMHSNNMGLNDKKPFLGNMSRKVPVPSMVTMERALSQYKFMEYLSSQAAKGKNNVYIDFEEKTIDCIKDNQAASSINSGIYLRIKQGKTEMEINAVEPITGYEPKLKKPFLMNEIFQLGEKTRDATGHYYGAKYNLKEIENIVNELFFGKYLMSNYKTNSSNLPPMNSLTKEMVLEYRERMWNWFYNGDSSDLNQEVEKIGKKIVKSSLDYMEKSKNQMNLWFSLEDYFNNNRRNKENMENIREEFIKYMKTKEDWCFRNDEEYYYGLGQIARYFLEKSQSKKKNMDMLLPILTVKADEKVKDRLKELAKKYAHKVEPNYKNVSKTIANVLLYKPAGKVNDVMIMAGYFDTSYLYIASKNEQTEEINME